MSDCGRIIRTTRQREVILEEIRKVNTHPTADEVYQMVRQRLPRVSLGTVYRNLEILAECGVIQRLELVGTQRRYDGDPEGHCHARCGYCGRVSDLRAEPTISWQDPDGGTGGFRITGYRLEFTGICPVCRDNKTGGAG